MTGQELRLNADVLLRAFADAPGGSRLARAARRRPAAAALRRRTTDAVHEAGGARRAASAPSGRLRRMGARLELKWGLVAEADRIAELGGHDAGRGAGDRLQEPVQGQPLPRGGLRQGGRPRARGDGPGRGHDPPRVLLRRVRGHPHLPREGRPGRQPQAARQPRGQRAAAGRRRHRPRRRPPERAVRGHDRRCGGVPGARRAPADARPVAAPGHPRGRRVARGRLARRAGRGRLAAARGPQPDPGRGHRGAQERGRDAPPPVGRGAPPPPVRRRRRGRLGRGDRAGGDGDGRVALGAAADPGARSRGSVRGPAARPHPRRRLGDGCRRCRHRRRQGWCRRRVGGDDRAPGIASWTSCRGAAPARAASSPRCPAARRSGGWPSRSSASSPCCSCWASASRSSHAARRTRWCSCRPGEKAYQEAQTSATKGLSLLVGDPVKAQESCSNAWGAITRAREGGVKEDVLRARRAADHRVPGHALRGQAPARRSWSTTPRT